jgi:hypothetical protein
MYEHLDLDRLIPIVYQQHSSNESTQMRILLMEFKKYI